MLASNSKPGKSLSSAQDAAGVQRAGPPRSNLVWLPLFSIAAAGFAVEIPFFFLGIPSRHDVEFHLYSWLEVLLQWKQGIVFPPWAAFAHFPFPVPPLLLYPPSPFT